VSLKANCPACGGPVTFAVNTSLVTVCPYCRSVVGRGDRGLEDLGKVADVVQSESPLDVGIKGRYEGAPFTLTGRTQYSHPAGGVWDEWYAAFGDGRWGWLAEAQGRFYVTFEVPAPELPTYDRLQLGQRVEINGVKLTVAEKNKGAVAGATGEMPFRLVPGKEHPFADLSGPRGEFATIDYSGDKPAVYLGREATLDELQIPPTKRRQFPGQEPKIQAVQLNCPHCGAALELRAPDKTERVGCPSCGALLDVREGKLSLLQSLEPPKVKPVLELGSKGSYQGVEWTVIGFMQRYVTFEGTDYFWEEYLLYQPRLGFRWLTRGDDHWNWVENVPPAAVSVQGRSASYVGTSFALFQSATAKVAFVVGEFYWKVQAGEEVTSKDYVHAPLMLSEEVTRAGDEGEVNWSKAVYVRPEEVERMFALKESLPRPTTIGPNQPFPHTGVYPTAAILFAMLMAVAFFFWVSSPRKELYQKTLQLRPLPAGQRSDKVLVDEPLTLTSHRNVEVRMRPTGSTPWMHVEGTLTPAGPAPRPGAPSSAPNNETRHFAFAALQGETRQVFLAGVPKGEYRLQYELSWQTPTEPAGAEVRLREGVPHGGPFVFVVLALGVVPLGLALYQLYWESRRWQESNP
jgi:nitrite reductase/ring-hydroxylating ferredoxin subunit